MSAIFMDTETPIGLVRVVEEDGAITRVGMATSKGFAQRAWGQRGSSAMLKMAVEQLAAYFAGTRTTFELPLRPAGTAFQRQAWQALCAIPFGQTRSYAEQARAVGRPTATRAIGAANGRNPIAIIVPCHRVIGSDGSLTGYAGGEPVKRWLLNHEGAPARAQLGLWPAAVAP